MTPQPHARLRPHHLMCLRFYRGEGYSPPFVDNLTATLERARSGGAIVVDGPDDICAACPGLRDNFCAWDDGSEAEVRRIDALASRLVDVAPGDAVGWTTTEDAVVAGLREWSTDACRPCTWHTVCAGAIACALEDGRLPQP
jgi:uncharacterized protein